MMPAQRAQAEVSRYIVTFSHDVLQRQDDLTLSVLHQLQVSAVLNFIGVLKGYFEVLDRLFRVLI